MCKLLFTIHNTLSMPGKSMLTVVQCLFLQIDMIWGGLAKILFLKENVYIYRFGTMQILAFSDSVSKEEGEKCTMTSENEMFYCYALFCSISTEDRTV